MIDEIKINIGRKVDTIYHLADIHVRNLKRHKEYRQVFDKLYTYLKKNVTENSLIYLGGDIVHAKTDLSPELVDMVQDFFKNLADIAPTILIAGNHDCNLNNESRLDALTPIIKALNHDNFYYLKDSGVYDISDIKFIVWSVFDKEENYIKPKDVIGDYKIILFHGAVNNSQTDYGFELANNKIKIENFKDADLSLLGDIHLHQFLDDKKTIAYPGSLIQQNHGEKIDNHGLLIWDLKNRISTHTEIENDYGYVTLEIDRGDILEVSRIPKKPRLRIKFVETDAADIKKIVTEIKKKYEVQDVVLNRVDSLSNQKSGDRNVEINFGNIRDIKVQNNLIKDYLDRQFGVDDDIADKVYDINTKLNQLLPPTEISRNIIWIPKKFEFSNMFSYGEDNVIDFKNMKGSYGLFAPNASGKSSLLDALTFCCFDKSHRASKGSYIINNKKNTFNCKFNFEISGTNYFIERRAVNKRGHVRVDVDFWKINQDGEKVSLNGEQRKDTNVIIKSYLGEYEDFILTTLSLQNNNASFIEMPQREKKELLAQFLDLNIFDTLYELANNEIKEMHVLVKEYQNQDFSTQLAGIEVELEQQEKVLNSLNKKKGKLIDLRDEYNNYIVDETKKLKPIDESVVDIESFKSFKTSVKLKIEEKLSKLNSYENEYTILREDFNMLKNNINNYNELNINDILEKVNRHESDKESITGRLKLLKIQLENKQDKLHKLEDHKYDPNCKYCMNNIFVKDAIKTKEEISADNLIISKLKTHEKEKLRFIETYVHIKKEQEELEELKSAARTHETQTFKLKSLTSSLKYEIESLKLTQKENNDNIDKYYQQKTDIKYNEGINKIINDHTEILNEAKERLFKLDDEIINVNAELSILKNNKITINNSINKLKDLENKYIAYEYYLDSVKRDGIPYELITKALPRIENEINSILTGLVDFNIVLDTDGKNINAYIAYDEDSYWPLELTSGMEKFISSLAIRTSLISITSLPRPNFIAIDEGFGTLDSNNLNSIFMLFDYLKSRFDFFITISHLDTMRDLMDHLIEIKKENSFSKIQYNI